MNQHGRENPGILDGESMNQHGRENSERRLVESIAIAQTALNGAHRTQEDGYTIWIIVRGTDPRIQLDQPSKEEADVITQ